MNMNFLSPKAKTLKCPREGVRESEQSHVLDILLSYAYFNANIDKERERHCFEHYIMTSPNSEVHQDIKDVLADLNEDERKMLFS